MAVVPRKRFRHWSQTISPVSKVVAGVGCARGDVLSPQGQDLLRRLERVWVDQRLVPGSVADRREGDLSEVGVVAQHGEHGPMAPRRAGTGAVPVGGEAIQVPPSQPPWAGVRSIPAMTRSMMVARSNSAKTPSICTIIRPAALAVSNGSVTDRNATPAWSSSIEHVRETAHRAGEPVHAVDQQQVGPAGTGLGQCLGQTGSVG